jgi:hypothetical protein
MTRRFDANSVAPFCALAAGFGARVSVIRRAAFSLSARCATSHVPTSQAQPLAYVRVMRATCATCMQGCACRGRPHASATFFPWDIGTMGRNRGER